MYILTARFSDDSHLELAVDDRQLVSAMGMLESHPSVTHFKVHNSSGLVPSTHEYLKHYSKVCDKLYSD